MNLPPLQQIAPKAFAVGVLVVAVLAVDRLTHLPGSAPLAGAPDWTAGVGERLELTGPEGPGLLQIDTGPGDGVSLEAGPARLDVASGGAARKLAWGVLASTSGGLEVPSGMGQDKVHIEIILDHPDPATVVDLERTEDSLRPVLTIRSSRTPLHVRAGVLFGDIPVIPTAFLTLDGVTQQRVIQTGFTVLPGGSLKLTFPTYANGSPSGMTTLVGEEEDAGPRLWLDKAQIVAEGAIHPKNSACAAPPGRQLWPMLWRVSTDFRPGDCAAPRTLAARELAIGPDGLTLKFFGWGYERTPDNLTARWVNWAKGNPLLGILMGVVGAGLVTWVWNTLMGKKS